MEILNMFDWIKVYHEKLGYDFDNMTPEECMNAIRDISLALNQEVAELVNSFPWKPWRKIEDQVWDTDNAIEEIVDIFFFLGEIMEAARINPKSLERVFYKKLTENYDRIKRGYNNKSEEREGDKYAKRR